MNRIPNLKKYIPASAADCDIQSLERELLLLTDEKAEIFSGALDIEAIDRMADIFQILRRLDNYKLLPEVSAPHELGWALVDSGEVTIHESAMPYVDYSRVAINYESEHGGAYTKNGYVLKISDDEPEPRSYVFMLHLISPYLEAHGAGYALYLPATSKELSDALEVSHAESFLDCNVVKIISNVGEIHHVGISEGEIEAANLLAATLQNMMRKPGKYKIFQAAVEIEKPEDVASLAIIADDLNNYTLYPPHVRDASDYAEHVLYKTDEFDYKEFMYEVRDFIDFEAYGEYKLEEDGIRMTRHGMLRNHELPFPPEIQQAGGQSLFEMGGQEM